MSVIFDAHYGIFDDTTINPGDDYITNTLIWQGYDNGGTPDGQIVYGGNSAGKNLTLTSTFDGTKGNIYLGTALNSVYDEVNSKLGIGTNDPYGVITAVVKEDAYVNTGFGDYLNVGIMTTGVFAKSTIGSGTSDPRIAAFSTFTTSWDHSDPDHDDGSGTNYGFDGTMRVGGSVIHKSIDGNFELYISTNLDGGFDWGDGTAYKTLSAGGNFLLGIVPDFNGTVHGDLASAEFGLMITSSDATFETDANLISVSIKPPDYIDGGTVNCGVYGIKIGNQGNSNWETSYGIFIDTQSDSTTSSYAVYSQGGINYFGGNVGIGDDVAPTKLLSVVSDSDPSIMISNSASRTIGNQERLLFGVDDAQNIHAIIFAENTGGVNGAAALGFYTYDGTTGDERMRIDSVGNIGIGITDPTANLHIAAGNTSQAPLKIDSGTPISGTPQKGAIENDGTALIYTDDTNTKQTVLAGNGGGTANNRTITFPTKGYGPNSTPLAILADPDQWLIVNIGGTAYNIPAYLPI